MWFGIILFGMANGFLLLPVILSFVGTLQTVVEKSEGELASDHDLRSEIDESLQESSIELAEIEKSEKQKVSKSNYYTNSWLMKT